MPCITSLWLAVGRSFAAKLFSSCWNYLQPCLSEPWLLMLHFHQVESCFQGRWITHLVLVLRHKWGTSGLNPGRRVWFYWRLDGGRLLQHCWLSRQNRKNWLSGCFWMLFVGQGTFVTCLVKKYISVCYGKSDSSRISAFCLLDLARIRAFCRASRSLSHYLAVRISESF